MIESKEAELKELDDNTDFTLSSHYSERIKFHLKMLSYYLKEEKLCHGNYH